MKTSYQQRLALPPSIVITVTWQPDATVNQTVVDHFVDALERPGWYTHDHLNSLDTKLYMLEVHQPFQVATILGKLERVWHCECCQQSILYSGIHIGHKTAWKIELKNAGVTNHAEAKAAYNNLTNLRIECATCNTSHDWE